ADDVRGIRCLARLPPSHAFVVVGLEAGLAVGSAQKSIGYGGSIGAKELRSRNEGDGCIGELGMKAIEDGDNVRGLTGIVSDERPGLVGKGPDHCNLSNSGFQREK